MCERGVARLARLGLVFALIGALLGPLLPLALDPGAETPFCGRDGRCCCEPGPAPDPDAPCVRSRCGCGRPEAATLVLLLRQPAVVADHTRLFPPLAVAVLPPVAASLPPWFSSPPPLPPPRRHVIA